MDTVREGDCIETRLAIGQGAVLAEAEVVRVEDATDLGPDLRPLPPTARPMHSPSITGSATTMPSAFPLPFNKGLPGPNGNSRL